MSERDSRATGFGVSTRQSDARFIESLDYLYGRINYERLSRPTHRHPFKLVRMRAILGEMGNPDRSQRIVHIGGTKGKGSAAAMVAEMATACGNRTGMYTSPHLNGLEERFRVDGDPATPDELIALIDHVRDAADRVKQRGEGEATFFELTTAIAIEHFCRCGCDLTILEVGLGGRLDSTNVCNPAVSAITSVGLDHQHILGDTVEQIAREKAGIIKPGVPIVSGVTEPSAAAVIAEVADTVGALLIQIDRDFHVQVSGKGKNRSFDISGVADGQSLIEKRHAWQLSLAGKHQIRNAAVAIAIVDILQRCDESLGPAPVIENKETGARNSETREMEGQGSSKPRSLDSRSAPAKQPLRWDASVCRTALANLRLPGRIEAITCRPTIIVDTAHNRDSMTALCDVIEEQYDPQKTVAVFGTSRDKDAREMITLLARSVHKIILTRYRTNPRWFPPQELAAIACDEAGQNWEVVEDASSALGIARDRVGPDGTVVICGSFFLASELRPEILALQES